MGQNKSKVALITGGARRIGAAIATRLHQAGYRVAIHAWQSKQAALDLCAELNQRRPNSAQTYFADLSDPNTPTRLIQAVLDWGTRLDVLVHNASQFIPTQTMQDASEHWHALFTINVQAPHFLSLAAQPHLAAQEGAITYITDIHAATPLKGYSVYCQTKAALTMQMLAFAKNFAPQIRVNAVAPGAIIWPEGDNALPPSIQNKIIRDTPLQKHGHPHDIADAVLALIQHSFITGQTLKVDGGRSL